MGLIRRMILSVVSAERAADLERHSRSWITRCRTCGAESDIWEQGGIRYKAYGNSITLLPCARCARPRMHDLFQREKPA